MGSSGSPAVQPTEQSRIVPVSVVVPARNEAIAIKPLLDALLAQTRPADEIIVVDAGSTDATSEIVRRYSGLGVRLLEVGPALPGAARNRGLDAARHDWVALVDAGCVPQPDWLAQLDAGRSALGAKPGIVWGSHVLAVNGAWEEAQALVIGPVRRRPGQRTSSSIASSLIHKELWRRVGGFREDLRAAEDLLFFRSLRRAGASEVFSDRAIVTWQVAPSVAAFYRRLRTYSQHHARSGLWATWHLRVAVMDLVALCLAAVAARWPPALALVGAATILRLGKSIQDRRGNVATTRLHASSVVRAAVLLVLADLAMWSGLADLAVKAVWARRPQARRRSESASDEVSTKPV